MNTEGLILVTGETGGLGRRVVSRLREAGRSVRVLSRRAHDPRPGVEYVIGDLAKDAGVHAVLRGAEVVVHCAGSPRISEDVAQAGSLVRGEPPQLGFTLTISDEEAQRRPGSGHRNTLQDHRFQPGNPDRSHVRLQVLEDQGGAAALGHDPGELPPEPHRIVAQHPSPTAPLPPRPGPPPTP